MNSPRSRSLSSLTAMVLALASGAACTAILAPRDDVQRCGSADDCEPTGDERYVAVCRFDPDNTDLDSTKVDKICVADYDLVGCDPTLNWPDVDGEEHPYLVQLSACEGVAVACEDALVGSKGCQPPDGGSCNAGLELEDGICIDPDDEVRIIRATAESGTQAVADQFCRSFYCDDRFVCNLDTGKCDICNDEDPFGMGGCGEVWVNGAPHPTYLDAEALQDECDAPESDTDSPNFGTCP